MAQKELPQVNDAILETEIDLKNLDESSKPLAMAVRQAKAKTQEASKELRSMQVSPFNLLVKAAPNSFTELCCGD